jgi:hypothetical protein
VEGSGAHIDLAVDIVGDSLEGHVTTTDGQQRAFSGWLGLVSTLQVLLVGDEPGDDGNDPRIARSSP